MFVETVLSSRSAHTQHKCGFPLAQHTHATKMWGRNKARHYTSEPLKPLWQAVILLSTTKESAAQGQNKHEKTARWSLLQKTKWKEIECLFSTVTFFFLSLLFSSYHDSLAACFRNCFCFSPASCYFIRVLFCTCTLLRGFGGLMMVIVIVLGVEGQPNSEGEMFHLLKLWRIVKCCNHSTHTHTPANTTRGPKLMK